MVLELKEAKKAGKRGHYFKVEDTVTGKKMNHLIVGRDLTNARIRKIIEDRTQEEMGAKLTLTDKQISDSQ